MLKSLFNDIPSGHYVLVKCIKGEEVETIYTKDPNKILQYGKQKDKEGFNAFYSPALRNRKIDTADAVISSNVLWVDLDKNYEPDVFLLPPTYVVNSGNNYHLYWQLDKQYSKNELNYLLKSLSTIYSGDSSVAQINALLRISGTHNHKLPDNIKKVEIQSSSKHVYTLAQMKVAVSSDWSDWIYKVSEIIPTGERSEHEFKLFKELSDVGFQQDLIEHIAVSHLPPTSKVFDDNNPNYLERTVNKVVTGDGNPLALYEGDGIYFTYNEKNQPVSLSNFVFKLKAIQNDNTTNFFIVDIIAGKQTWRNVPLPSKVFVNANTFNMAIPFVQMTWFGNDTQTKKLKKFLSDCHIDEGLPLVNTTTQIGIQGDLYVTNEQVYNKDLVPVLDTLYIPPISNMYPFIKVYAPVSNIQFFRDLLKLNGQTEMLSMLGWFTASHIKPALKEYGVRFPHLIVTGSRGAGKTTLITRVFQPYVGYVDTQVWQSSSTPFVLLSLLGSSTSVPICLTEYRENTQKYQENFKRVLRTHYDDGKESKGRVDLTTVTYPLTSPICIDGEEQFIDAALLERIISVHLDVRNISKSEGMLSKVVEYDIHGIGAGVLNYILIQSNESIYEMYKEQLQLLANSHIAERIKDNYAVVNTGLKLLYNYLGEELAPLIGVNTDLVNEATKLPAYTFLESLINNTLSEQSDPNVQFKHYEDKHTYAFNLSSAYSWFNLNQHRIGAHVPPKNTIRNQLLEMDGVFIEIKNGLTSQGKVMSLYYIDLRAASKVLDIEVFD